MKSCKQSAWQSSTRPPVLKTHTWPVANPGEGPAPLFLDQTEARRDKKNSLETAPHPPLSQGLDPPLVTNSWRLSHGYRELPVMPMIRRFSRASIPQQTVMPCNLTLTILSVAIDANHLGSYLIKSKCKYQCITCKKVARTYLFARWLCYFLNRVLLRFFAKREGKIHSNYDK